MIIANELRREVKKRLVRLSRSCSSRAFGYPVAPETRERSLRRFYNRLQSQVHGRNWNRRHTDQRMIAVGVWERLDSNPHCHVLISASDDESAWLFGEGNKSWLWLQPRGQFDISEIEAPRKVISYITKEIYKSDSQDQLFVYKAPLSNSLTWSSMMLFGGGSVWQ